MVEIARLEAVFGADTSEFDRATRRVHEQLGGTQSALKQLASTAAGFVVGDVVMKGLGTAFSAAKGALIDYNDTMDRTRIGFTAMLGSAQAADKLLRDLTNFARTTPFELSGLLESSQLLIKMGFAAQDVIPALTAIGDQAAAAGKVSAESINRITLALGQMATKGKVQAQEMLQLIEAGVPAWDILSQKLGISTAKLQEMSEKGLLPADKALKALIEGMEERAPGAMDKMSSSWATQVSNIRDTLTQLSAQALRPLFDLLREGASVVSRFLQSAEVAAWGRTISEMLSHLSAAVKAFFGGDMALAAKEWDAFKQKAELALLAVEAAFASLAAKAAPHVGQLVVLLARMTGELAQWGANLMIALGEGMMRGAQAAIGAAVDYVANLIAAPFRSHSPPETGPLKDIEQWGANLLTTYIEGMTKADFGLLDRAAQAIRDGLQRALAEGGVSKLDVIPLQLEAEGIVRQAIEELRNAGQVSEETWSRLAATIGTAGGEVAEYVQALVQVAEAEAQLQAVDDAIKSVERDLRPVRDAIAQNERAVRDLNRAWEDQKRPLEDSKALVEDFYNTLIDKNKQAQAAIQARIDLETAEERRKLAAQEPALAALQLEVAKQKAAEAANAVAQRRAKIEKDLAELDKQIAEARKRDAQEREQAALRVQQIERDIAAERAKAGGGDQLRLAQLQMQLAEQRAKASGETSRVAELEARRQELVARLNKEGVETAEDRLNVARAQQAIIQAEIDLKKAQHASEQLALQEEQKALERQKDAALRPIAEQLEEMNRSHRIALRTLEDERRPLEAQRDALNDQKDALESQRAALLDQRDSAQAVADLAKQRLEHESSIAEAVLRQRDLLRQAAEEAERERKKKEKEEKPEVASLGGRSLELNIKPPLAPEPEQLDLDQWRAKLEEELDRQIQATKDRLRQSFKTAFEHALPGGFADAAADPTVQGLIMGALIGLFTPLPMPLALAAGVAIRQALSKVDFKDPAQNMGITLGGAIGAGIGLGIGGPGGALIGGVIGSAIGLGLTKVPWKDIGSAIWDGVTSGLEWAADKVMAGLTWLWDRFIGGLKAWLGISSPSKKFAEEIGIPVIEGLWHGMQTAWETGVGWLTGLPARVIDAIGDVTKTLVDKGKALMEGLWEGVTTVAGWAKDGGALAGRALRWYYVELPQRIAEAVGDVTKTLVDKGRDLISGLWDGVTELAGWAKDGAVRGGETVAGWFAKLADRAVQAVGDVTRTLYGKGKDLVRGLTDGLGDFIENAAAAGKNLIIAVAEGAVDVFEGALRTFLSFVNAVKNALNWVLEKLHLPTIPDLVPSGKTEPPPARAPYPRAYARGTDWHPGGLALVGEEGPELVELPQGARVLPAEVTRKLLDLRGKGLGIGGPFGLPSPGDVAGAVGRLVGGALDAVRSFVSEWVTKGAAALVEHVFGLAGVRPPDLGPLGTATALLGVVRDAIVEAVKGWLTEADKAARPKEESASQGAPAGPWAHPVPGAPVTQWYGMTEFARSGYYKGAPHTGIDFGVPTGTPVHAAARGTVTLAGWYGGYGNAVVIDHGAGLSSLYGHLQRFVTAVGKLVERAEVIAYSDNTGNSTGAHLHFEVRRNGAPTDPRPYLGLADGGITVTEGLYRLSERNQPEVVIPLGSPRARAVLAGIAGPSVTIQNVTITTARPIGSAAQVARLLGRGLRRELGQL